MTTLIQYLKQTYPDTSTSQVKKWLEQKRVRVNDHIETKATRVLETQDHVVLDGKNVRSYSNIPIVYQDREVLVVRKPAGLLTVPTPKMERSLFEILKKDWAPKPVFVIHRLDKGTSGLLVFALSEKAMESLKEQFRRHKALRIYHGLVEGEMPEKQGVVRQYLLEDSRTLSMQVTQNVNQGVLAITHYQELKQYRGYTVVRFTLETGKKHQIRVACSSLGAPIVGDKRYGAKMDVLGRLALHSSQLEFVHPVTHKKMQFIQRADFVSQELF